MKLDIIKFKSLRKKQKLTLQELAQKVGRTRNTLSSWENGKSTPSESKIRMLARILDTTVDKISDLEPEIPLSSTSFSEAAESWHLLANSNEHKIDTKIEPLISGINSLKKELRNSKIIIDALLSTSSVMIYIKDQNQRYITANKAFLKNTAFLDMEPVLNKTDSCFFSRKEAEINFNQDKNVLLHGKPLLNVEEYIPGTRKKKWGLISKTPVFDTTGNIAGLIGTFVDITKRKEAEYVRKMLEGNVELIPDAVGIFDVTNQELAFISNAMEELTGYSLSSFDKDDGTFWKTICVHPDDRPLIVDPENTNISFPKDNSLRIIRADGKVKKILTRLYPKKKFLCNDYVMFIMKDITEE